MGPALAAGFAVGALVAWWGPGGNSLRRGTRSIVRGVVRPGLPTGIVAGALIGVMVVLEGRRSPTSACRPGGRSRPWCHAGGRPPQGADTPLLRGWSVVARHRDSPSTPPQVTHRLRKGHECISGGLGFSLPILYLRFSAMGGAGCGGECQTARLRWRHGR